MQKIRYYGLLTVLCLCLYLPGLARLPLFDRDEPHFAQASRQMLETRNYWQINFQSTPRRLKPPGIYWLQATAVRLFSSAESTAAWPYRLPSVLGALLAVLLTFALGRRVTDEKTAALGAALLACSVLLVVEARLAVTDAVLLATMVAMQFGLSQTYLNYQQRQQLDWFWPLIFWLSMAAGVFIKGITPLIGGLTILGLYLADRRQTGWLKALRCGWGIPLLLLLTAAWLIPFSVAANHNFLWDMIHDDVLPKLTGGQQSHGMPPGYFSVILTAAFWPASLFIVPAGVWAWRRRQDPTVRFLLAWIVPAWIFFELAPTKLPEYVLPLYPAIALLTAFAIMSGAKPPMQRWLWLLWILQQALWIICTAALTAALIYLGGWAWLTAVLVAGAAAYLLYIYYHPALYRQAAGAVIVAAVAFMPVWHSVLPDLKNFQVSRQISALITKTAPDSLVLAVSYREPSLVFLLGTHRVRMTGLTNALAQQQPHSVFLLSFPDLFCFASQTQAEHLNGWYLGKVDSFPYNQNQPHTIYLISIDGVAHGSTLFHQADFLGAMAGNRNTELFFCGSAFNLLFVPAG